MRAPLSIVIPTLNAAQELPDSLASLMEGLEAGLIRELIVSDGGSTDQIEKISQKVGAEIVVGPAGRGQQLNLGAAAAKGDWVLFLHADTHLAPGWSKAVAGHIRGSTKAGFFWLRFRANGVAPAIVSGWANFRSRLGLPYGDQGLLISRAHFHDIGGYPAIDLMEDVLIARRLRGQLVAVDSFANTSAEKYRRDGWVWRGAKNIWLLLRFLTGTDPRNLADKYRH